MGMVIIGHRSSKSTLQADDDNDDEDDEVDEDSLHKKGMSAPGHRAPYNVLHRPHSNK